MSDGWQIGGRLGDGWQIGGRLGDGWQIGFRLGDGWQIGGRLGDGWQIGGRLGDGWQVGGRFGDVWQIGGNATGLLLDSLSRMDGGPRGMQDQNINNRRIRSERLRGTHPTLKMFLHCHVDATNVA